MNYINQALYRNLKSGNEFHNLIPKYQGIKKSFEKGNQLSDTHDTLKYMAKWSEKYSYQFKEVAKKLKRSSVKETVDEIYNFLYNHFQYNIDEDIQNLYSPSAAWHFRHLGFDCKTYSILASCLLNEMNPSIEHSFRMVQQNGISPGQYTHVYVVVHENNKEYVIDATKHQNTEVLYIKKHDYKMKNLKHIGLAAPFHSQLGLGTLPVGLGCSCQGITLRSSGLGSPVVVTNTLNNLSNWLLSLEKNGLSRQTAQAFYNEVKNAFNNNVDPYISSVITVLNQNQKGLNGLFDSASSLFTAGAGIATGNPLSIISGVSSISSIIAPDLMGNTIGAVFANGFDPSCWGANYNEATAKANLQVDLPSIMSQSGLDKTVNVDTVNNYSKMMFGYFIEATINSIKPSNAACTKKGHKARADATAKMIFEVEKSLSEKYNLGGKQMVPLPLFALKVPGYFAWESGGIGIGPGHNEGVYAKFSSVTPKAGVQTQQSYTQTDTQPKILSQNSNGTYNVQYPNGQVEVVNSDGSIVKKTDNTITNNKDNDKDNNSMLLPMVIGGGALAFFLLMPRFKDK